MAENFLRFVAALVQLFAAFPIGFAIGLWFLIDPYEMSELHSISLMLHGGTGSTGSNEFAYTVTSNFIFGLLGCFINMHAWLTPKRRAACGRLVFGFAAFFLLWLMRSVGYVLGYLEDPPDGRFFVCDYLMTFVVFATAYLLSALWIAFVARSSLTADAKYFAAPMIIAAAFLVAQTGITPKAGKGRVLSYNEVPVYSAVSHRHAAMLAVHRACTLCTGAWPPVAATVIP